MIKHLPKYTLEEIFPKYCNFAPNLSKWTDLKSITKIKSC